MKKQNSGSALLLSMILLFVVLSLVTSLSYVTVMEQKMSQKTKSSVGAFYNADSGVEWALNKIATTSGTLVSDAFGTVTPGNGVAPSGVTEYKIYLLDDQGNVITTNAAISEIKAVRAVGTQNTGEVTQRAIEAAVAAGGGACFVSYKGSCSGDSCCTGKNGTITGFTNKGSLGDFGSSGQGAATGGFMYVPPGANNPMPWTFTVGGEAFLCCQN